MYLTEHDDTLVTWTPSQRTIQQLIIKSDVLIDVHSHCLLQFVIIYGYKTKRRALHYSVTKEHSV